MDDRIQALMSQREKKQNKTTTKNPDSSSQVQSQRK